MDDDRDVRYAPAEKTQGLKSRREKPAMTQSKCLSGFW